MNPNPFEPVVVTAQPDRFLIPAGQVNERYILVSLKLPTREIKSDRLPLNLSLIIDRSGSMSGDKLTYVKEAVTHALRILSPTDRVSIVIYDDVVEVLAPSQLLQGEARQQMINQVQEIYCGGMTNLSGGWQQGGEQVIAHFNAENINRLFLLTDGLANVGISDHEELVMEAKKFQREQISTTTFGVGDDFNEFLLQGIADNGGGHFYFIASPEQIPNYFKGELGEMMNTVARNMALELHLPSGATAELVNKMPLETSDNGLRVLLGDSYSGDERKVIFKVKLPACELREQITVNVSLQYEDVQQHQLVTLSPVGVTFTAVSENAYHQQSVNQDILQEAVKIEVAEAKLEALRFGRDNQLDEVKNTVAKAKKVLHQFMAETEAEEAAAELETLADKLEEGMTARDMKSEHYGSHMVRSSRKDHSM